MARKTVMPSSRAICIRCHKKIGKGKEAIVEQSGLSHYYYHPHCYKAGYVWYHGRYVKK